MDSKNGWILPDGEYIECGHGGHIRCAEEKMGMKEEELEKIAVKVTVMESIEDDPIFLTERKRMTQEQLRTIEKYCVHFRYRPPLEYFYQQDLDDLEKMITEDILSILARK
ncbi:MAG: hypothetical protein M0Q93_02180 [Terrimicrobiaceae bacterium]|nr:hypothetical protein [Terrimicrobiaceae bacterium]